MREYHILYLYTENHIAMLPRKQFSIFMLRQQSEHDYGFRNHTEEESQEESYENSPCTIFDTKDAIKSQSCKCFVNRSLVMGHWSHIHTHTTQHTSVWHTFWMIPRILIELITFFRYILIKSTSLHLYHRALFHFTYPHPFPFVHICCRFYEPPETNMDTYMCVPKLWPSIHEIWGGISPRITLMDWVNTVNRGLPLNILIHIYYMMPRGHNTSGLFNSLFTR